MELLILFLPRFLKNPSLDWSRRSPGVGIAHVAPISADACALGGTRAPGKAAEPRTLSAGSSGLASVPGPRVSPPWELSLPALPWTRRVQGSCRVPAENAQEQAE